MFGKLPLPRDDGPVQHREEDDLVRLEVDALGRPRFDRRASGQYPAQADEAGAAHRIRFGLAGHDVGQAGLQHRRQDGRVVGRLRRRGRCLEGEQAECDERRAGAKPQGQQAPQAEAHQQVQQAQQEGRGQQPGQQVDLAALGEVALDGAGRELGEGAQLVESRGGVEGAARLLDAIETGRMVGANPNVGEVGAGNGPDVGWRRSGPAEGVEGAEGVERSLPELAAHALAKLHDAPQHVHEKARERQVGPSRIGGGVEQHEPALAAALGGHERSSVAQRGPALGGEIELGLGQHLASHPNVVRNAESGERTMIRERRQPGRPRPGHRPAQGAAARSQRHGNQLVGLLGKPGAGESHQHAAPRQPFLERRALGPDHLADVRQHQQRKFAPQKLGQISAAYLAERRQRPFQVIEVREQRLRGLGRAARNQPNRPPPPAFVEQHHSPRRAFVLDFQPHQPVAQLDGQLQNDLAVTLTLGEG